MQYRAGLAAGLLLAAGLRAQTAPPDLYRIDLLFNGQAFALDEPKLQGDTYVFRGWPDGSIVRLKRLNVRKITAWTRNPVQKIAYKIDVVPSGHILSRDEPTLKGTMYVFHTSLDGTAMSLRQADVRKITRLTREKAFQEERGTRGEVVIGTLAMQGGSSQAGPTNLNAVGRPSGGPAMSAAPTGNWIYQGIPGVSDAYAPASATVASPGDVPQMPAAPAAAPPPR